MTERRIPFNKPSLVGNELRYVQQAIDAGHISGNGAFTKRCHAHLEHARNMIQQSTKQNNGKEHQTMKNNMHITTGLLATLSLLHALAIAQEGSVPTADEVAKSLGFRSAEIG